MIVICVYFFRETHGSGSTYHKELSKQLATFLEKPLNVSGSGGEKGKGGVQHPLCPVPYAFTKAIDVMR